MNIVFITYWYPSKNNPLKGIFIKKHAHAVAACGCNVRVLSLVVENANVFYKKEILKFKDEAGLDTIQILVQSRFYKFLHVCLPFHYFLVKKQFKYLQSELKINVIHSHVLYPAAIIGYKLSRQFSIPHVITEHWSKVNRFMSKSFYAGLGRSAYTNAYAITTVSQFLKENIKPYIDSSKTYVVPNIINTQQFNFKPKAIDHTTLRFCIVAHWFAPKRPDLVFKSLEAFSKTINKKISLNVIGEGPLLDTLKTEKWNFEVIYSGNKPADKLAIALQESDFFLHASDIETFSIVIAEALSTGTPVLASNVGAISELINSEVGVLSKNSVDDWTNALKNLTQTNYIHQQIAITTKKYSPEIVGEQFKKIYFQLKP